MADTVSVQIHGSEYKLRGDDAERIKKAASLVDEQMRFVASKSPTQPALTTAVLAALNTTDLFMDEQDRSARELNDAARRIDTMNQALLELIEKI